MRSIIKSKISRRAALSGGAAIIGVALLPTNSFAMTSQAAEDLIHKVIADVLVIINSGKAEADMLSDFTGIFTNYGAVSLIAKTALGAPGRLASSSQLSAYIRAFEGYISRKYGRQFRKFAGADFDVVSNRDAGSKGFLIETTMRLPRRTPFEVEWWVIDVSGRPKFFDLKIEGISLITTERAEIGAMLEAVQGNIDALIANLNVT